MIVDTHLLMSQILYKYIKNQVDFKLNKIAFAYGNIKPDFSSKDINRPHTLDESLYSVNKYSKELMSRNVSTLEFSKCLGIICHFSCDYFCLYHRDGNEKKGIFEHVLYEFILHIKLIALLLTGTLKFGENEIFENSPDVIAIKLEREYNLQSKNLTRDITYALCCASKISKLIVCSSQLYIDQNQTNISKHYHLHTIQR